MDIKDTEEYKSTMELLDEISIKKEFVPYDLAIRLKELGFDKPCFAMWTQGWSEFEWSSTMLPRIFSSRFRLNDTQSSGSYVNNPDAAFGISAPTFSQCFTWFRENYHIIGEVKFKGGKTTKTAWYDYVIYSEIDWNDENPSKQWKKHEEAELECLKKMIELVEQKK